MPNELEGGARASHSETQYEQFVADRKLCAKILVKAD
jgi:hypothetical protein